MTRIDADVAIIGSGFSGALAALALRKRGQRVALIERGRHPRFAIGESSTPLANLLLEELADRYDLPGIRPFSKWGTWQRARPDVAGGLKRGFTFFFHQPGSAFADDDDHARQLLVAASPSDEVGDTHWYRPDFDHALVREAEAEGAVYLDETRLDSIQQQGTQTTLEGERRGSPVHITAQFVIDASGPRGFLHRALGLGELPFRWMPGTQGIYSHFEGVERWDRLYPVGDVEALPHPIDDAALHHVFPGGWIWMLRFNNGITSAGAALTDARMAALLGDDSGGDASASAANRGSDGGHDSNAEPAQAKAVDAAVVWERLLDLLPSVCEQFRNARAVIPFVHAPRVAFRSRRAAGENWALLPSAAGVIDPLLSAGFPLTLLGLARLLDLLEHTAPGSAERAVALRAYEQTTIAELDVTEQMVGALYASMDDPPLFKRLSLLYFAAASFSEAVRRLGRPALAPGFLLREHPQFGPELRACLDLAVAHDPSTRAALFARIDRAIEPFDTAGLLDRTRRDWYPVLADDLIAGAPKLHASVDEVQRLLERCGLMPARTP